MTTSTGEEGAECAVRVTVKRNVVSLSPDEGVTLPLEKDASSAPVPAAAGGRRIKRRKRKSAREMRWWEEALAGVLPPLMTPNSPLRRTEFTCPPPSH